MDQDLFSCQRSPCSQHKFQKHTQIVQEPQITQLSKYWHIICSAEKERCYTCTHIQEPGCIQLSDTFAVAAHDILQVNQLNAQKKEEKKGMLILTLQSIYHWQQDEHRNKDRPFLPLHPGTTMQNTTSLAGKVDPAAGVSDIASKPHPRCAVPYHSSHTFLSSLCKKTRQLSS